jgi:lauroyl/myristoyl acyltransferase
MKQMVNALKNNKVISMIVDQSVNSRDGVEVKFLGKKANQTKKII